MDDNQKPKFNEKDKVKIVKMIIFDEDLALFIGKKGVVLSATNLGRNRYGYCVEFEDGLVGCYEEELELVK